MVQMEKEDDGGLERGECASFLTLDVRNHQV